MGYLATEISPRVTPIATTEEVFQCEASQVH